MIQHWGTSIYWDAMSWEAFAAIVAVIAAGIVGWRQAGISKRQAELQALDLKAALWDRRMAIYDATKSYLSYIVAEKRVPEQSGRGLNPRWEEEAAIANDFKHAVDRSRFLLSPEVFARLDRIKVTALRLSKIRSSGEVLYNKELETEAAELRGSLEASHENIASIFGEDLILRDN